MYVSRRNPASVRRGMTARPWRTAAMALGAAALVACMEGQAPTEGDGKQPLLATALATAPSGFTDAEVAHGLVNPTLMEIAPDGRIFVSEQAGKVRVIKNGALLATPFVALNVNSSGERGALGIAFDPAFASNHYVYVYYTSASGPHNRISRFTANGDVAAGGETVLFDLPTLSSATNHNGGSIHFGADGKLYVSVGENASPNNSQSLGTPLGKLLRINPDGSIPSDNPFYGSTTGNSRAIWALGLRNPYTFGIQPGTGRIFINDVGQNTWEEIDEGIRGANYGWPTVEGPSSDSRFQAPFYAYDHGSGCAIAGGAFYNPANPAFPSDYQGDYFFADYCGGWIRRIDPATKTVTGFATGISSPTDVRVGNDGAVYYVERGTGSVRKITYANPNQPPVARITSPTAGATYIAGRTYSISGTATDPQQGDLPASAYTWEIRQWHDDGMLHSHPAYGPVAGITSFNVTVPDQGETSPNVWYRIYLTATNAQGLTDVDSLDVHPVTITATLASDPAGLQLKLDGIPVTAPYTFTAVAGMRRTVEAVTPQNAGGSNWSFASWSDGGAVSHTVTVPTTSVTLTAAYRQATGP